MVRNLQLLQILNMIYIMIKQKTLREASRTRMCAIVRMRMREKEKGYGNAAES